MILFHSFDSIEPTLVVNTPHVMLFDHASVAKCVAIINFDGISCTQLAISEMASGSLASLLVQAVRIAHSQKDTGSTMRRA